MLPRSYVCRRASCPIPIDGDLDKEVWNSADWSEDFVDIEWPEKPDPPLQTRMKMLWDEDLLYIGAKLEEPRLWATLTERDSVIFHDNDFEVFLDPDGDSLLYVEIEVNALNTVWDLLLTKPYREKGKALTGWSVRGLQTGVRLDGVLNDPGKPSRGWSVELALPWASLQEISEVPCPPRPGDVWRMNFSRVEWDLEVVDGAYRKIPGRPEHNWVWTSQHAVDMHRPEHWGSVRFEL